MAEPEQRCSRCGALLSISIAPWISCVACGAYNHVSTKKQLQYARYRSIHG